MRFSFAFPSMDRRLVGGRGADLVIFLLEGAYFLSVY